VYSVLPYTSSEQPSDPAISAADGTAIPCWGWRTVTVTASGRTFCWQFLLAGGVFALIGGDFPAHFDIQVDLKRMRLVSSGRKYIALQQPPRKGMFALYRV
jgi:hypothetical protein